MAWPRFRDGPVIAVAALAMAAPSAKAADPVAIDCTTMAVEQAVATGGSYVFRCSGAIFLDDVLTVTHDVAFDVDTPSPGVVKLQAAPGRRVFSVVGGKLTLSRMAIGGGRVSATTPPQTCGGMPSQSGCAGAGGLNGIDATTDGQAGSSGTAGSAGGAGDAGGTAKGGCLIIAAGATVELRDATVSQCGVDGAFGQNGGIGGGGGRGGDGAHGRNDQQTFGSGSAGGAGGSGAGGAGGGDAGDGGDGLGGAIYNDGTLVVSGTEFTDNYASGGPGGTGGDGGRAGDGGAGGAGGAGCSDGDGDGACQSPESFSTAAGAGGGCSGNGADGGDGGDGGHGRGGAIYNAGTLTISGSTFRHNSAFGASAHVNTGSGGGRFGFAGTGGGGCSGGRGGSTGFGANPGKGGDASGGGNGGDGGDGGDATGAAVFNAGTMPPATDIVNEGNVVGPGSALSDCDPAAPLSACTAGRHGSGGTGGAGGSSSGGGAPINGANGPDGRNGLVGVDGTGKDADLASTQTCTATLRPTIGAERAGAPSCALIVDDSGDLPDADPTDGACDTDPGPAAAPCTLRAAILEADARPGADLITFSLPSSRTIAPVSPLPDVTGPVTLQGPTGAGGPIQLSGAAAGAGSDGLRLLGGGSRIDGLAIRGFDRDGIFISGPGGNTVASSLIGTNAAGTTVRGNGVGIRIERSAENRIGVEGGGNVISGSGGDAVQVVGAESTGNVIAHNTIGLNSTRTAPLPNLRGVRVVSAANTTIGPGNVISGNTNVGVEIESSRADRVVGNAIGTTPAGAQALGNGDHGIWVHQNSESTVIGGGAAGEGNLIANNGRDGILIQKEQVGLGPPHVVAGNLIGTDPAGKPSVGFANSGNGVEVSDGNGTRIGGTGAGEGNTIGLNAFDAIVLDGGTTGVRVQGNKIRNSNGNGVLIAQAAHDNTIGGTATGAGNVIVNSALRGVLVTDTARANGILGNSISASGDLYAHPELLGIDLGEGSERGPSANDPGDADAGPNDGQNAPEIELRRDRPGQPLMMSGKLSSVAHTTYRIEFFAAHCDPLGFGEGERLLRVEPLTLVESTATFTHRVTVPDRFDAVTATATDPGGNTSEFSRCAPRPGAARIQLAVRVPPQSLAAVRRAGAVSASCRLDAPGSCRVRASISAVAAKRLGLRVRRAHRRLVIGQGRTTLAKAGRKQIRIRLARRVISALAGARRPVRTCLVIRAVGPGRRPVTASRTLVLR
jgi:hypothetical protein